MSWIKLTTSTGDTVFLNASLALNIVSSKHGSAVFLSAPGSKDGVQEIQVQEDAALVAKALKSASRGWLP